MTLSVKCLLLRGSTPSIALYMLKVQSSLVLGTINNNYLSQRTATCAAWCEKYKVHLYLYCPSKKIELLCYMHVVCYMHVLCYMYMHVVVSVVHSDKCYSATCSVSKVQSAHMYMYSMTKRWLEPHLLKYNYQLLR